jgi:hypothetical protein
MVFVYLALKTPTISWLDSLFYWSWSMYIGIATSMLCVFFILLDNRELWPLYPSIGTFVFAVLITIQKFTLKNLNKKIVED